MTNNLMSMNVILTFNVRKPWFRSQEYFDLNLQVNEDDGDVESFLNRELFPKIISKCQKLRRNHENVYIVSTCGDWDLFEKITGKPGLDSSGHSCKWYLGPEDEYVGKWGKRLKGSFGLGKKVKSFWFM